MVKRNEIAKIMLGVIATAGILTVAVVAPGILPAIVDIFGLNQKYTKRQLKQSFRKMERAKLISVTEESGKTVVRLTKLGKEKILKFKLEEMKIKPQKHWDRKWRIVIFDVPKDFHMNRTMFTLKLKEIGMKQLQKSVWISPYPCEDEVDFIKEIYLIRPYVRVITAHAIDIQNDLIKTFNLS